MCWFVLHPARTRSSVAERVRDCFKEASSLSESIYAGVSATLQAPNHRHSTIQQGIFRNRLGLDLAVAEVLVLGQDDPALGRNLRKPEVVLLVVNVDDQA